MEHLMTNATLRRIKCIEPTEDAVEILTQDGALIISELLSLTLANFAGSSAARDSKHRIVLDDLMSAFEHEFHASHVAKSCPAAFHI